jgi:hypothetical protein
MVQSRPGARFKSDIRINKKGTKIEPKAAARPCDAKDCPNPGDCRVPKSRENLGEYFWYCSAHARAHNENWDFFRGMDNADIAKFREEAILGHRPTWPLGKRAAKARTGTRTQDPIHDSHALFEDEANGSPTGPRRPERQLTRLQATAMDTMQLAHNATLIEIKARYKELVKRFHPDANGGDRGAEERLKQVIKAYGVLRQSGLA